MAEYEAAEQFCARYPPHPPILVPSALVDRIQRLGCSAWGLELPQLDYDSKPRFFGSIHNVHPQDDLAESHGTTSEKQLGIRNVIQVRTTEACKDVSLLSNLPILAGLYDIKGKEGVYFEVKIINMQGFIAIGSFPYGLSLTSNAQRCPTDPTFRVSRNILPSIPFLAPPRMEQT